MSRTACVATRNLTRHQTRIDRAAAREAAIAAIVDNLTLDTFQNATTGEWEYEIRSRHGIAATSDGYLSKQVAEEAGEAAIHRIGVLRLQVDADSAACARAEDAAAYQADEANVYP